MSVFNLAYSPYTNTEYKQISSVWFEDHLLHFLAFRDVLSFNKWRYIANEELKKV